MSHESICPNCGQTTHTGLSKEIEDFILQYAGDITIKLIANKFSLSEPNSFKYLEKFTKNDLLFKHYQGKKVYYHRIVKA